MRGVNSQAMVLTASDKNGTKVSHLISIGLAIFSIDPWFKQPNDLSSIHHFGIKKTVSDYHTID